MQVWIFLLLVALHVSEGKNNGCVLDDKDTTVTITAYTGGSVLLPCYCNDLNANPETFTWMKQTGNTWKEVSSDSSQNRNRVQLANDHYPGNLSLLISDLTEADGGYYKCVVKDSGLTYVGLTVKGCTPEKRETSLSITAHTGESVLLPCSCTDLRTKPETFTWEKNPATKITWEVISTESDHRLQLFNDHSPTNLSLLISHLTKEDEGWYKCVLNKNDYTIKLTVEGSSSRGAKSLTPVVSSRTESSTINTLQNGQPTPPSPHSPIKINSDFFIYGAVGGFLLLMVLIGVICWRHRAQKRGPKKNAEESNTQQGSGQETQESSNALYCTIPSEQADNTEQKQNDSEVMYASINLQSKRKKVQEKDDVTYSSINHSSASTPAHKIMDTGESTEYASIKLN